MESRRFCVCVCVFFCVAHVGWGRYFFYIGLPRNLGGSEQNSSMFRSFFTWAHGLFTYILVDIYSYIVLGKYTYTTPMDPVGNTFQDACSFLFDPQ